MEKRLVMIVTGRVQGVFFRASTRDEGRRLGVTGWVRNLPDGRVEVLAEGSEPELLRLASWCRMGPPGARVEGVELSWSAPTGEYRDFSVRR
jgi:acylphosphatase